MHYESLSQFIDWLLSHGHRDIRLEAIPLDDGATWLNYTTRSHGLPWGDSVIQQDGKIYPIIPF